MDEPRLALLQGDLQGQWEIVDGVFSRIAARHGRIAARQGRRSASVEQVEALAYQLHNLYGACEQGALRPLWTDSSPALGPAERTTVEAPPPDRALPGDSGRRRQAVLTEPPA